VEHRSGLFKKFRKSFAENKEDLCPMMTKEMGKPIKPRSSGN